MIKKILILFMLFALIPDLSFSQLELKTRKKFAVDIHFGYQSGSSYYDIDGKEKFDFQYNNNDTLRYITAFGNYMFGVKAKYNPIDELNLYAEIPFAYFSSSESYLDSRLTPNINEKYTKASFGFLQPMHYGIGAGYKLLKKGMFIPSILFDAKLPPTLKNGRQNSEEDSLLRFASFELFPSAQFLFQFERMAFALTAGYNLRDNDLKNQYKIRLDGGFSSDATVLLKGYLEAVLSADSYNDAVLINPRRMGYQQDYYGLGLAFHLAISREFHTIVSYDLKLAGKNGWSLGIINITGSVLF